MGRRSCGFEADGFNELAEIVDGALVEAVELRSVLAVELASALMGERNPAAARAWTPSKSFRKTRQIELAVEEEPVAARVLGAKF